MEARNEPRRCQAPLPDDISQRCPEELTGRQRSYHSKACRLFALSCRRDNDLYREKLAGWVSKWRASHPDLDRRRRRAYQLVSLSKKRAAGRAFHLKPGPLQAHMLHMVMDPTANEPQIIARFPLDEEGRAECTLTAPLDKVTKPATGSRQFLINPHAYCHGMVLPVGGTTFVQSENAEPTTVDGAEPNSPVSPDEASSSSTTIVFPFLPWLRPFLETWVHECVVEKPWDATRAWVLQFKSFPCYSKPRLPAPDQVLLLLRFWFEDSNSANDAPERVMVDLETRFQQETPGGPYRVANITPMTYKTLGKEVTGTRS